MRIVRSILFWIYKLSVCTACPYILSLPRNITNRILKNNVYLFRFFSPQWPVHTCRRRHYNADDNDLSYDSIRFRYFSSRLVFFFMFFNNTPSSCPPPRYFFRLYFSLIGSGLMPRVSRRRRRNEPADRLPPPPFSAPPVSPLSRSSAVRPRWSRLFFFIFLLILFDGGGGGGGEV